MGNNHGDRKSPKWGNIPLINGLNGLEMEATKYLLQGGPLLVINGVITSISRVITPVTQL